jgi:uncharacterized membrane protein
MHLLIIIAIIFVIIDSIYLALMSNYFQKQIKTIQGSNIKFKITGAVLCYVILVFGLYHFIIKPKRSILEAFILGIVIYGVYETTNFAIFDKWNYLTVLLDTLWGGVLFASTTYIIGKIIK